VDRTRELAIRLCGGFDVTLGGRCITSQLPGRQGRLLLAYMACNRRRAVTRDELIELLWPIDPPAHPEDVLSALVSKLRRGLGAGMLRGRRELTVNLPAGASIDLELAEDALERGEAALAAGEAQVAWGHAQDALALIAGEFLPGFHNRWVEERRRDVEELRLRALGCVAGAGLALGGAQLASGERAARELISAAPLSELGYRQVMEILAARGDVAGALQVFDRLRVALRDELGIAPGPAVRTLHERLLSGGDRTRPATEEAAKAREAQHREERKLVAVLAAEPDDTETCADPEELRVRSADLVERIRVEVERFGGTVEDTADRTVLTLFGATVAHEDDAERAVRAALRLCDRGLAVRAGVATGEVLVAPRSSAGSLTTGKAISDAVRRQRAASLGGVLVDELTVRATPPDAVVYEALGDGNWAVQAVSQRLSVTLEHPWRTRFIGRENELSLLESLYKSVLEQAHPLMVVIVGHAGVGKSRLIDEFLTRVETPGPTVYRGRCLAYGEGITYWALREVLWAASRISLEESAIDAEAKLHRLIAEVVPGSDADRVAAALAVSAGITLLEDPLAGVSPASVREEISWAWPAFLSGLAASRPTVLVIEDLHWAEEPLLALIERLLARSAGPLLLVVSARPEFAEARQRWSARPDITQIGLPPLPEAQARVLVAGLLPAAAAELKQRVLAAAEGNPFFAEQLARHLTTDDARHDAIPGGIRALLAARVDGLPAAEKRALQDAAIVGRVFWATAIESIESHAELEEALAALERRGLLVTRPSSSLRGHTELSFGHGLVRDVAYQSIPRAQRCRAHAAVGVWLEQRARDRREELIELIAYHYERASLPEDAALGWPREPDERQRLRAKAVQSLLEASEGVRRRSSLEQALRYAERAQALAGDERDRLQALELTARAQHAAARPDEALAAYRAAIEIAHALGDRESEIRLRSWAVLLSVRYYGHPHTGWKEHGVELIEAAIADADVVPGTFAHATALIGRAGLRERLGVDTRSLEEAKREAEQAVAIAEAIGPSELLATALESLTWTVFEEGLCGMGVIGERLLRASLDSPDRFEAHENLVIAAMCFAWAGDFERAAELTHEATARLSGLSPHRATHSAAAVAVCLAPVGHFSAVGELTTGVLELVRGEGARACNQAIVGLAARLLWLFETEQHAELGDGLRLLNEIRPPSDEMGPKTGAASAEALRPIIGTDATHARLALLCVGPDRGDAILLLRVQLPVLALGKNRGDLDRALADARKLARSCCAPALGWIADWAAAVQIAANEPAAALARARRATTALARYGERYTAARLMCDLLPLLGDATGIAAIANQTADELEAMGAHASAAQARAAVTSG
jgi:predicted ATPase/DNA-binding SARP family transcriptional activator